ncbi:hypothetical protein D9X91_08500 [Falsibacillus albus]|uniref:Uncharacterized protein n=1 Tax=Falsibacillus albus TaxID=2478915 RepID=A0A3L7K1T1_9BACI|nr:hypothetical protein D9X91_08500 [Falsibacillus albus]
MVGKWTKARITKITLQINMITSGSDKSYIGKEVYMIDFPTSNQSKPSNIIVFADIDTLEIIGNGLVD